MENCHRNVPWFAQSVVQPEATAKLEFSPLFVTLHEGFERLLEVVPKDEFVFIVNGEAIVSTVTQAVLISPKIYETFRSCPGNCGFRINDEHITANDFRRFLDFVRSRVFDGFSDDERSSFLSISSLLGNDELTYLLIMTLKSATMNESKVISNFVIDANDCASQFYCYSIDLIRRIDRRMLHEILSSEKLKLETEDELLRMLIDLGSDYFDFWCYIEVSCLSDDGIDLFVENVRFDDLTESIWLKIIDRLRDHQSVKRSSERYLRGIRFESVIVKDYPDILKEFRNKKWNLLYRGSRDGFGVSNFHGKCDNQSNTLTLIETTKGSIFGGFTPLSWDSTTNNYKSDSSQSGFLFNLKNPRNSAPQRFRLSSGSNAIYCNASYGPTFGSGHDIYVSNGCNANTSSYTSFGNAYVNDTGIQGNQVLAGEYNFTVKEIEVFAINL
jgi:hypothetical protein